MRLLVASLLLIALAPQDKIELKQKYRQGDTLTSTRSATLKITGKMVMQDREQDLVIEHRTARKRVVNIEAVADGRPTRIAIDTEDDYEETKEPGALEFKKYDYPTKGTHITVSLVDGKLQLEGADTLDARLRKHFTLEDQFGKVIPKRPVAVGESWEFTGKELQSIINDETFKEGKLTLKLKEVKDVEGKQCAIINARHAVKFKGDQGEREEKLAGDIAIWIDTGYALSAKLEGTATFKEFGRFKMTGDGPFTLEFSATVGQ